MNKSESKKHKWETEPNELLFEYKGLKCMILRVYGLGHLCGYVGINFEDANWNTLEDMIDVHGSITFFEPYSNLLGSFSDYFAGCTHVIGFDAGHAGDLSPQFYQTELSSWSTYRDIEYVKAETESMAEQILKLQTNDWRSENE